MSRVEIFSAAGVINISRFFILLERLRNNFLLGLTLAGVKSPYSPAPSHSSFSLSLCLLQRYLVIIINSGTVENPSPVCFSVLFYVSLASDVNCHEWFWSSFNVS